MGQLLVVMASLAALQVSSAAPRIDAQQRRDIVKGISSLLNERYLYEPVAKRVADVLQGKLDRGEFDALSHPEAFAAAVTDLLQRETHDRHLWIWYRDGANARLQFAAVGGPMIGRAEVLPGNIGYVEIRHFVGNTAEFDAAMEKVRGVVGLVLDLRQCAGGNREQVRHLSTYFYANRTRLPSRQARGDQAPIEDWTLDSVPGPRFPETPTYVLTSQRTFSAGEGFALGLRVTGRALLVGERTGGGGHFVQGFPLLPHGFQMLVPVGRNLDPRTGESWEGVGLVPDVAVNPEQALQAAIGHLSGWRR
jgi:hypothetical protein